MKGKGSKGGWDTGRRTLPFPRPRRPPLPAARACIPVCSNARTSACTYVQATDPERESSRPSAASERARGLELLHRARARPHGLGLVLRALHGQPHVGHLLAHAGRGRRIRFAEMKVEEEKVERPTLRFHGGWAEFVDVEDF